MKSSKLHQRKIDRDAIETDLKIHARIRKPRKTEIKGSRNFVAR